MEDQPSPDTWLLSARQLQASSVLLIGYQHDTIMIGTIIIEILIDTNKDFDYVFHLLTVVTTMFETRLSILASQQE